MPKSKNRRKSKQGQSAATPSVNPSAGEAGQATMSAEAVGASTSERSAKTKVGPAKFFQQVRDEMRKVTWTTRNETLVSTLMVMVMVAVMSVFFFSVDQILRFIVPMILSINI